MPCPLGGLRAAELAAGEWRSLFHELADVCLQEILASAAFVDMQDMCMVTQDWERGKTTILSQLELKLRYWESLPWTIAGLVHNDDGVARAIARKSQNVGCLRPV